MSQIKPILNNDKQAWAAAKARREREKLITGFNTRIEKLELAVQTLQKTINEMTNK